MLNLALGVLALSSAFPVGSAQTGPQTDIAFEVRRPAGQLQAVVQLSAGPPLSAEGALEWQAWLQDEAGDWHHTRSSRCEVLAGVLAELGADSGRRLIVPGAPQSPAVRPPSLADGSVVTVWARAADSAGNIEEIVSKGSDNSLARWARRALVRLGPCWSPRL